IGHAEDSLWSLDLFRCESAILRTYWVLVVMDQFTRRIVGFAVHRGVVDGVALCRMFNRAIHAQALPKYLSSDHNPLYRFHQWQANLHVLAVQEIKPIWRTNSGSFRIISIDNVCTRAWEDDCQILRRRGRHQTFLRTGGSSTVAASTRRPSPRDFTNSPRTPSRMPHQVVFNCGVNSRFAFQSQAGSA